VLLLSESVAYHAVFISCTRFTFSHDWTLVKDACPVLSPVSSQPEICMHYSASAPEAVTSPCWCLHSRHSSRVLTAPYSYTKKSKSKSKGLCEVAIMGMVPVAPGVEDYVDTAVEAPPGPTPPCPPAYKEFVAQLTTTSSATRARGRSSRLFVAETHDRSSDAVVRCQAPRVCYLRLLFESFDYAQEMLTSSRPLSSGMVVPQPNTEMR
jgi:hypothetical protein